MTKIFPDTNIPLYSISRNPREAHKRDRAIAILARDGCGLSVQVLQEFYVQATRPTRNDAIAHDLAVGLIRTGLRFQVQETTVAILKVALEIKAAHGFSYWDSAIIAAALALGCSDLHTEDMSPGRRIDGVTLVDPFR
jgi:predicted nucleic acid-binding protein